MIDYSQIDKTKLKDKDSVINNAILLSGLKKEYIVPIYESFSHETYGDIDAIDRMFFDYFNISEPVDTQEFTTDVKEYIQEIGENSFDISKRRSWTDRLIDLITNYTKGKDLPSILEILAFSLYLKNPKTGSKLLKTINYGEKSKELFEMDDTFNFKKWNSLNLEDTSFSNTRKQNAEVDLKFYSDVKYLLNDIFRSFNNYHIDNVHSIIVDYLNNEIKELTNISNVLSIDDSQYEPFIKELITLPTINALYYNPDYLRTITPDLQTLLLDLALIVHDYIKQMSRFNLYIDQEKIFNYNRSSNMLLESISTSIYSSYFLNNINSSSTCSDSETKCSRLMSVKDVLNNRLGLEEEYTIGLYNWNRIATDCLLIIKGIQNEFPIKIRKILNIYISNCLELIHSYKFIETRTKNIVFPL